MTLALTVAAGSPLLVILGLMLGLRWSATKAGAVGLALAVTLALAVFRFGQRIYPALGSLGAIAGVAAEAGFVTITILWIILPALAIYQLQQRTGALETLRVALGRVSSDLGVVALLVAWFFSLFIEGAAGFGTSAALAAPFLVSAGFRKIDAVTIALVGHSVGVSFGAVGTPILPQIAATDFSGRELATAVAQFHSLLGIFIAIMTMLLIRRALGIEKRRYLWLWTLVAAACFFVPYYAIARFIGPELPSLAGALVGAGIFITLWTRFKPDNVATDTPADTSTLNAQQIVGAASPYLLLVIFVVATRLIAPVGEALRQVALEWTLAGTFSGSMQVLYHPGTLLFASFFLGALWQRAPRSDISASLTAAGKQLIKVSVALFIMLSLSRLMVHATMIDTLATSAAATLGSVWPLLAPFVGVLGTFVTGSATASNILFTDFQLVTAQNLNLPPLLILGAQCFGAAVGNIICPHNIIAASATVALSGEEGTILRRTLGICVAYGVLGGLLAWLLVTI
jgi:lactate permease